MASNILLPEQNMIMHLPKGSTNNNITRKIKKAPNALRKAMVKNKNSTVSDPEEQYAIDLIIDQGSKVKTLEVLSSQPMEYLINYIRFSFYPKESEDNLRRVFKALSTLPIMGKEHKECCSIIQKSPVKIQPLVEYVESVARSEDEIQASLEAIAKKHNIRVEQTKDFDLILNAYFQVSHRRIAFIVLSTFINRVYTSMKDFEYDLDKTIENYNAGLLFEFNTPNFGADDVIFDYTSLFPSSE